MKLSVVIPSYNEQKNLLAGCLQEVIDYLNKQKYTYEVLIVDDGSKDKSVSLIKKIIKGKGEYRLIENSHGGKAIAVMTGLLDSKGDIALFTDMDQATPIDEIQKILPEFGKGYDIVIGSRSGREGAPLIRKILAFGFVILRNSILGLPFKDTQCGFKAFSRKSIDNIFPDLLKDWQRNKSRGSAVNAGFDAETLFIAKKKGFTIAEVGVRWRYVGTERVQAVKDSLDAVKDILRVRFNDFSGKYK